MDVRQIRDFVAVVRCSSFAAASRDLRISQPGLAYQIKQLEQELRVQLLQRHARGVSLTSAGRTFMEHAERILAAVNQTKVVMAEIARDDRRLFAIGLSPSPAHVLGTLLRQPGILSQFRLRLREGFSPELRESLSRGEIDMAICPGIAPAPLQTVPLYNEPLFLIGPVIDHARSRNEIALADVVRYPLVLGPFSHQVRQCLEEAAAAKGLSLTIDQEIEAGGLRRSLVLRNGCYTVSAIGMFAEEIEGGFLCARRIVVPELMQTVNMAFSPAIGPALEQILLPAIRSLAADAPKAPLRPLLPKRVGSAGPSISA